VASRIVAYTWVMVATSLLLVWPLGVAGGLYLGTALVTGAVFLREAHLLLGRVRRGVEAAPMRLFHWSITYLALLFLAVALDQLV
jgi:protoheme IX farnesyltransferase